MSSFRFGSHLPVLMKALQKTNGPVLELGRGLYSTVFLHWLCYHKKRKLVTLEGNRRYLKRSQLKKLEKSWHTVRWVGDWDKEDLKGRWSVVLIDHAPGWRRPIEVAKLTKADYIVVHDTDKETAKDYGNNEGYDLFKYRLDYKPKAKNTPQTTILSNKHNLEGFMDD